VRITNLASAIALCAASTAIVACGGSSSPTTTTQPTSIAQHPRQTAGASGLDTGSSGTRQAQTQPASGGPASTQPHGAKQTTMSQSKTKQPDVSRGRSVQKGHPTPVQSGDDNNPVSSNQPNPCKLVSLTEAKAITGGAIAGSTEAPLGPTCIYKVAGSKAAITLNVESLSFSQATSHMAKRQQITVRGRRGYCGNLGAPMLYIPLSGGQILHVTAPCGVAARFADLALGRLAA
jgi:hypothetical protein